VKERRWVAGGEGTDVIGDMKIKGVASSRSDNDVFGIVAK